MFTMGRCRSPPGAIMFTFIFIRGNVCLLKTDPVKDGQHRTKSWPRIHRYQQLQQAETCLPSANGALVTNYSCMCTFCF